ncbi:DUF3427 domain-containing protein [Rossellomorea sp. BNER]|nr:DUF3427 domain-containing protein [Rossellomorea sp. BNER]
MRNLIKYYQYDRKEIHDIFSPHSTFQPSRGTWGLQGIVRVPDRLKDYVFMVTFTQSAVEYQFDESVTDSGVLTWQSQPKQSLNESRILDFISHDHIRSNIYLFLRTNKKSPYTYLGKLAYLSHDPTREKPVHFKWQILDWKIKEDQLNSMGLELVSTEVEKVPSSELILNTSPDPTESNSKIEHDFRGRKIDFAENDERNRELGLSGELLVLDKEKEYLTNNGRADFAEKVVHVSQVIGDGTGYDILSYSLEGEEKYIEVKTTRGGIGTPFYISSSEYHFALDCTNYALYRLYNFNMSKNYAEYFILKSKELTELYKEPINYRVFPRRRTD